MKKIALILGFLLIVLLIYIVLLNTGVTLDIDMILGTLKSDKAITILLFTLLGMISAFLISYYQSCQLKRELKALKRKLEKSCVSTEESSDKVKLLEDKIKTLETALEQALKK